MFRQFDELAQKLSDLPEAEQAQWVAHFLEELRKDNSSEVVTEVRVWVNGHRPSLAHTQKAIQRLRQFRKGITLGDDLTTKDLINEGRRD